MTFIQLTLVGHVGRDVELRLTAEGQAVANFSLAVNEAWKNKDGAKQERTTWFKITCWNQLAETMNTHLSKGSQVLVVGDRIEASAYLPKDGGEARASLEVTARTVRFLGSKGNNGQSDTPPAQDDEIPF